MNNLDVRLVKTVTDDRVKGTCFQDDKYYDHSLLKSIDYNDNISRLVIEPGHEVCLYSHSGSNRESPSCCINVDKDEAQVKLYDVFKDSMFFNSKPKEKISAIAISPFAGSVPYKKASTPVCGEK